MAFQQPNCLDADSDQIRWSARCTAADEIYMEVDTVVTFDNDPIKGSVETCEASKDYVAKGVVGGLLPATEYFWRFVVNGSVQTIVTQPDGTGTTPVSITTAPADDETGSLKIAVGSCLLEGDHDGIWKAINASAPDLLVLLGDSIYVDTQVQSPPDEEADYWTAYNLLFDNSSIQESRFQRYCGFRIPIKTTIDDHDTMADMDVKTANWAQLYEWGQRAWKQRFPVNEGALVDSGKAFRVERFGKADLFFLDSRQRKNDVGDYARFPDGGADNHAIDATSTRTVLYVTDSGAGHTTSKVKDAYAGWYVRLADTEYLRTVVRPPRSDLWRRVIASESVQGEVDQIKLTLNKALPDTFDPTVEKWLFMENATILDANTGAVPLQSNNQFDWLVSALNASTARWRIIMSPLTMNETHTADDNWKKYSALCGEVRALYQSLDDPINIVVCSGDTHRHGLDDGTNAEWPDICSSPLDQAGVTGAASTWSNGQAVRPTNNPDGSSNGYAVLTITQASIVVDFYWSNFGTPLAMSGITSLTHNYVEPTVEDFEMNTKKLTLSGVQTNAAVVTPPAGEKVLLKSVVVTANSASDLVLSRGNASDTTTFVYEENATRVERHFDPPMRMEPDEVLRFSGGVAAQDTTIVAEYATR